MAVGKKYLHSVLVLLPEALDFYLWCFTAGNTWWKTQCGVLFDTWTGTRLV